MKALSILLDSSISLDPMNTAIQELISASTEVNEEAKVILSNSLHSNCVNFLSFMSYDLILMHHI